MSVERIGGLAPLLVPGRHFVDPRPRRRRARGRRPQAEPHHPGGGARHGAGAARAVPRHRRRRPRGRARARGGRRPGDLHAGLRRAVPRRRRHAGARRPRRRLRDDPRPRAVRGGARRRRGSRASPACTRRPRSWAPRRSRCGCAPTCSIVLDGDFCSDTPAADAKELAGEVRLGAGPVLSRGAGSSERLVALAREVAAAEGIPVQIKAYPGETEHGRRRADGGRHGRHADRRPADALHALAVRGRAAWTTSRRRLAWWPRSRAGPATSARPSPTAS